MQFYEAGKYKLVALDMDGTLLNSAHETSEYTRDVILRASAMGKNVAISTGRCLSELWEHLEKIKGIRYVICENGACVYDIEEKKIIHHIAISHEDVLRVFETVRAYDLKLQYFKNTQSVMQYRDSSEFKKYLIDDFAGVFESTAVFVENLEADYEAARGVIGKFNLYCTCEADKQEIKTLIERKLPGLILSDSIGVGLEVSPAGATKGIGLERLCAHLGIPVDETIAVGDASNDLEVIRTAGLSVAMGNAIDELKRIADVVTEDCDHDGAAKAIQRYMLGENI